MAMKIIFSLITILILCSFDKVSTKAVYTTYETDRAPYEYTHTVDIFIPSFNISVVDKPSERERLIAYVIEELELLAEKVGENSPLHLTTLLDYSDEEEEEEVEEEEEEPVNITEAETATQTETEEERENQTEDETETQTEDDIEIVTKRWSSELQAACEEYLNKVVIASEKYWKSLSAAEQTRNEEFSEWLEELKNTEDVVDRMDLLNDFFHVTESQIAYK